MRKLLISIFLFNSTYALATEYTFTSKLDHFMVDVSDAGATYEGQPVSLEPFEFVKPLFDAQLDTICEAGLSRPDLTITQKVNETEIKRHVYIDKKLVTDGKSCATVTGHGLYQLPLHHNWFVGKKTVTIGLGNNFSIWKSGRLVVEFDKNEAGNWINKDKKFFTNWKFFADFLNAVTDFNIDYRVHPSAAKNLTTFELRQGGRIFTFVKVGDRTWAVQFPGTPWFAASGRFGIFEDMSQTVWLSPQAKTLKILADKTALPDNRVRAVREMASYWGPDLNRIMSDILFANGENLDVKKEIVSLLRKRPTDENFKVLVDSLQSSTNSDYLNICSKALRARNPKGEVIETNDTKIQIKAKIQSWLDWRKTLK